MERLARLLPGGAPARLCLRASSLAPLLAAHASVRARGRPGGWLPLPAAAPVEPDGRAAGRRADALAGRHVRCLDCAAVRSARGYRAADPALVCALGPRRRRGPLPPLR